MKASSPLPADIDLCMVLGAGWPFWLGGITPYLDRSGVSERCAASASTTALRTLAADPDDPFVCGKLHPRHVLRITRHAPEHRVPILDRNHQPAVGADERLRAQLRARGRRRRSGRQAVRPRDRAPRLVLDHDRHPARPGTSRGVLASNHPFGAPRCRSPSVATSTNAEEQPVVRQPVLTNV